MINREKIRCNIDVIYVIIKHPISYGGEGVYQLLASVPNTFVETIRTLNNRYVGSFHKVYQPCSMSMCRASGIALVWLHPELTTSFN